VNSGESQLAKIVRESLRAMRPERPVEPAIREVIERGRAARSRRRVLAWGAKGMTFAAAAAAALVLYGPFGSKIQFTVGPEEDLGIENSFIGSELTAATPLHFSDGTAIDLLPGTRARVASLGRRGANLNLETGHLHADVVHKRMADWSIGAGPYTVRVIGTEFDVFWNPDSEELEVDVRRGLVKVTGPALTDDQSVAARQRLTVAARERNATLSPFDPDARVEAPAEPAPAEPAEHAEPNASAHESSELASPWVALAKRGEYQKALDAVQRTGFDAVMQSSSASELLRLSDVARMGGQPARAAEILHVTRRRFPRTDAASVAAYTLGVTAFDQAGSYAEAAKWFGVYLRERPSGPLAAEAMGRLMEAYDRLGRRDKAEATARKYLSLYPNGAHKDVANRLTSR